MLKRPEFVADVKLLAEAGLSMDTANPNPNLIGDVVRLTDRVPELRFMIDHLPQMAKPTDPAILHDYKAHLQEIGKRPQIYVKISEVFVVWMERFRTIWASTRPISMRFSVCLAKTGFCTAATGRIATTGCLIRRFSESRRSISTTKGQVAAEKYFWKNSVKAYRWVKRDCFTAECMKRLHTGGSARSRFSKRRRM